MCHQAHWALGAIVPKHSFPPAAQSRLAALRPLGQEEGGRHAQALPGGTRGAGRHCPPGMAPFREAHSCENKGFGPHLGIPRDQTHFSHKQLSQLPPQGCPHRASLCGKQSGTAQIKTFSKVQKPC